MGLVRVCRFWRIDGLDHHVRRGDLRRRLVEIERAQLRDKHPDAKAERQLPGGRTMLRWTIEEQVRSLRRLAAVFEAAGVEFLGANLERGTGVRFRRRGRQPYQRPEK